MVVTHDRPLLLRRCLQAIAAQSRRPDAVLVVDNASGAETARVLGEFPQVRVLRQPATWAAPAATARAWRRRCGSAPTGSG
jgi:GT2 family glycosyltransferase